MSELAAYEQGYQDGAMAVHAEHDAKIGRLERELAEAKKQIERFKMKGKVAKVLHDMKHKP